MEFRLPFSSAKPPFYVSLTPAYLSRTIQTWEGPYGTHDVDFNWGSRWGDISLEPADNKDANNALEVLYLKDIPKRSISTEGDTMWLTNSRVQIQETANDSTTYTNEIEIGIRDCDTKHRPWDGLTIEVTGYISYSNTVYPFNYIINDVVFEIVLAKDDFQTTPLISEATKPFGLGYDSTLKVFWFLIDGPEVPSGAITSEYIIQEIVSVTPTSPFEPPTPA